MHTLRALLGNPFFLTIVSTVITAMRVDYEAFKGWKDFHSATEYNWPLAIWRWFQAFVIGLITAGTAWAVSEGHTQAVQALLVFGVGLVLVRRAPRAAIAPVLIATAFTLSACGGQHTPPNLSPAGAAKWHATRAIQALDTVRDVAIAGNEIQPPVISTKDTRTIVEFHQSAVTVIGESPSGWRSAVKAALNETLKRVEPDTAETLRPYVDLVKAIINEVR